MMRYFKAAWLLIVLLCATATFAQSIAPFSKKDADSSTFVHRNTSGKFVRGLDKIAASKYFNMTSVGVPLVVSGLIVKGENDHFHDLRNQYIPLFRNHLDDYLQYMPAVAMVGLKVAGVEGRSSWERILVADAISLGLMAATVNSLKSGVHVLRPDGSDYHSFPSGHTAMAFMTATMLHKEYGMTRSPWYSVGAYTVATATAIMRQLNNKHWMSDVLTGAGIGILSVEFGYFLTDLMFREKGITRDYLNTGDYLRMRKPSFLGIYGGLTIVPGSFSLSDKHFLRYSTGSNVGVEGAWFMNPYVGFGGLLTVSGMPVLLDNNRYFSSTETPPNTIEVLKQAPLSLYSGKAGVYFSLPVSSRWFLGSKLLSGINRMQQDDIESVYFDPDGTELSRRPIVRMASQTGLSFSTGISVTYLPAHNLGARLFADYNLIAINRHFEINQTLDDCSFVTIDRPLHQVVLGASVSLLF